jgi:polysaccharide pyruvyl transferase WcaK-like protein
MSGQILISNVFGDSNKGGAAITMATVDAVRQALPQSSICLIAISDRTGGFGKSHRFTLDRFPDLRIRGPLLPIKGGVFAGFRAFMRSLFVLALAPLIPDPAIKEVKNSRLVVSKGGHLYVERQGIKRSISLWMTSFPILLASRLNIPTAVVCTTIGPFTSWHSRFVARSVLRRVGHVVARDEFSYHEGLKLGLDPSRLSHLPDIVFSLAPPDAERCERVASELGVADSRFCVVTICEPQDAEFADGLRFTLREIVRRGYVEKVLVVPHASEDYNLSRDFVRACDDTAIAYLDADLSPSDLIALYANAQFVIGRRMHSSIFALVAATPVFAFAKRGLKVQGVMKSLGLGDYIMPYPRLDAEAFVERIGSLVTSPDAYRERIRASVSHSRDELQQLPELLGALMRARPNATEADLVPSSEAGGARTTAKIG